MIYIYHRFIFIVDTVFWIVSCLILLYNSLLFFDCVESYQSSSLISIAQMILSFSISACMLYNLSFFLSLLASSFLSFLFKPFSLYSFLSLLLFLFFHFSFLLFTTLYRFPALLIHLHSSFHQSFCSSLLLLFFFRFRPS